MRKVSELKDKEGRTLKVASEGISEVQDFIHTMREYSQKCQWSKPTERRHKRKARKVRPQLDLETILSGYSPEYSEP
jgi:hypothetical protein